ncbi:hypothetical protein MHUMG1_08920 [Metarhizium humberi]|uniref:Phytanoyl-CoA dioxygenase n=1 Tax=Metarhizium humberi TaxID=2596975 RepID=A0A9P8M3P0_9HYPO|nr:hypothetical protein MHUMG1_08920 [Metarhizium humberi]
MTISMPPQPRDSHPRIPANAGADAIVQTLKDDGFVIIEGFISPEQAGRLNEEVDGHMETHPYITKPVGKAMFGGLNKRRANLPEISKTFREDILNHELLHAIGETIFGPVHEGNYWIGAAGVLDRCPGTGQQLWHRDGSVTSLHPLVHDRAPLMMITFLVALSQTTKENGATLFCPGSHKWDIAQSEPVSEEPIVAELRPGDACLLSWNTVHAGGSNQTAHVRRAMALSLQSTTMTPIESSLIIPRPVVESMTQRAQRLVAWRSAKYLWRAHYDDLEDHLGLKSEQPLEGDA